MLKMVYGRKLSRNRGSRSALFRSLIKALADKGQITTTKAKAKAVQPNAEKLITLVKRNTLASRRQILAEVANDKATVDNLWKTGERLLKTRSSGFTRITNLPVRLGDKAPIARLEWVEVEKTDKKEERKESKK